ncbi:nuclear RNA binding [Fusarium albosuccineum]|uniref:Nuclear RNA binding n=1 Tax=Fusarium albosuccineum TaxID=1237068 RepID=A0A8H4LGV6_9HYPO|nr:nuclear RNA binding [Fusarium albosuccineum]
MNDNFNVWTENKAHSVEGHTYQCTLTFQDRDVWGPYHCHENTHQLGNALHRADPRFNLRMEAREKTVEGHTRSISVKFQNTVILDRLSTHDNMDGLCQVIRALVDAEGGPQ